MWTCPVPCRGPPALNARWSSVRSDHGVGRVGSLRQIDKGLGVRAGVHRGGAGMARTAGERVGAGEENSSCGLLLHQVSDSCGDSPRMPVLRLSRDIYGATTAMPGSVLLAVFSLQGLERQFSPAAGD